MQYFVIGERELVLAFKLVGVDGNVALTRQEVLESFNRVTGQGTVPVEERPKVLILTESAASLIDEEVIAWQKKADYPLIVEIPGIHGHLEGRKTLTDAIREAVGINV